MNSNFNKFDFDLGIGSTNRSSKSLNDQKNNPNSNSNSNSYSYSYSTPAPSKTVPAWTHQPAPPTQPRSELGGPRSMVGDITGKSWNSAPQKAAVASSIGIVNKNPNLFGDLVNSALGQNKSNSNVPLKNSNPVNSSFSMGNLSNSLPKGTNNTGFGSGLRSGNNTSNVGVGLGGSGLRSGNTTSNVGVGSGFGSGLGGSSLRSGTASASNVGSGSGLGGQPLRNGMGSKNDPFGSFVDLSSKPMKNNPKLSQGFDFGGFQNAPKSNPSSTFPSGGGGGGGGDSFDVLFPSGNSNTTSVPQKSTGGDSFDAFFPSAPASVAEESGVEEEWGFGGGHEDGNTTELDGLPPPPAGVSATTAKSKGLDNYKQGQYADAIKWLSWAEVLLEKNGNGVGSTEVLSCRASCYKEVGEYKKAVADCTKVLNNDEKNVAVLVQRALLYESMEKYRLGADDLRTVMKLDPGNRVARSTIHRLNKMAD